MPSKTSLFNKEIFLQIVRSTGWISLIYFLGLLFSLPIRILMIYTENNTYKHTPEMVESLFQYDLHIQVILFVAIPILMSIFLFRFLQVKQSAEFMHSLPIKREKIYHQYTLSGIIGLVLPVILVTIILLIMHNVLDLNSYFQIKSIFTWSGITILLSLLMFIAGVFVAMMTGISVVQGVLTYVFLLFPAGIILLLFSNLSLLLFGFPGDYYLTSNLERLSPLTYISLIDERNIKGTELIIYLVVTILLYLLALYFYKKRKTERASEAIAFSKLRSIFKYGVTFCFMLFGGAYFSAVQSNSVGWMIFGYVIGAVIGYYLAEIVLQKTWRVFGHFKGILIYGVIATVCIIGTQTFGFYENHVPEQDEVKNVLLADTHYVYMDKEIYGDIFTPSPLKEQENIEQVRKLHQEIIKHKDEAPLLENNGFVQTAFFKYELKNGKTVIRQYRINQSQYKEIYQSIHESKEYKQTANELFQVDVNDIRSVYMRSEGPMQKSIRINNSEDIREMIDLLKEDMIAESYADKIYFQGRGTHIELFLDREHQIYLNLQPNFTRVNQWLEERDLLNSVKVTPDDIAYVQAVQWEPGMEEIWDGEAFLAQIKDRSDIVKITDSEQINEITNHAGWGYDHKYVVLIHYKGQQEYPEIMYLNEAHTPEFIK